MSRGDDEWRQRSNGTAVSVSLEVPSPAPPKRRSVLDRLGPKLGEEPPRQQRERGEASAAAPKRLCRGGSSEREREDRQHQIGKRPSGSRAVRCTQSSSAGSGCTQDLRTSMGLFT